MKLCLIFLILTHLACFIQARPEESLRDSLLKKGDYKQVIEYDDSIMKQKEELRQNTVKEIQLKAIAEAKEFEYKHLKHNKIYNEKRKKLLFVIFILLCSGSIVFMFYISSRRTNMKRQTVLINAEKEEAKLKLKLIEEQAIKLELQKYKVLLEFNLKEIELSNKIKDFNNLCNEKKQLNAKVENYRQRIGDFEASVEKTSCENNKLQKEIIEEITTQIKKHLPRHEEYIRNLEHIKSSFIDNIMHVINGNLSKQYLKYCICFATGLSIKDVSRCCFVEQSSVYMIRYRLKKKFELRNDDDIDLYLKKLSL
ncbi:MAG: hypothetical protein LBD80_00065 [Tannerella sp.]|jgi:hypothetical protein|nr:hypothetical protein [Tannerella sp.]